MESKLFVIGFHERAPRLDNHSKKRSIKVAGPHGVARSELDVGIILASKVGGSDLALLLW